MIKKPMLLRTTKERWREAVRILLPGGDLEGKKHASAILMPWGGI
jgi:hypothetical protein